MNNAAKLLELAEQKFGELTEADVKLFTSVANGEVADFSSKIPSENDPTKADSWSKERILKADKIEWLCLSRETLNLITQKGIQIIGARFNDAINLSFMQLEYPLLINRCRLMKELCLTNTSLRILNMTGTICALIIANGLKSERGVYLRDGFRVENRVILTLATIGGNLDCKGGHFGSRNPANNQKKSATIDADGIIVKGAVIFQDGAKVIGEARFVGAKIESQFICKKSMFLNDAACSLNLDSIVIKGGLILTEGFMSQGRVDILLAKIYGNLELQGSSFDNPKDFAAINADFVFVEKSVYIRDKSVVNGILNFTGANIGGAFVIDGIDESSTYALVLKLAQCTTFKDNQSCWPRKGFLVIDGFEYSQIDSEPSMSSDVRLEWLRLQNQEAFSFQPYKKLEEVLRKNGHEEDAKEIMIAKNKDEIELMEMPWLIKKWKQFLGLTIGFGYRPWWALRWAMGFIMLGCILFGIGYQNEIIMPTYIVVGAKAEVLTQETPSSYKFNALIYSIDSFIPLLNFHEAENWLPNGNMGSIIHDFGWWELRTGSLLCAYMYGHIFFGWLLTTLLIVGLTGLLRQ